MSKVIEWQILPLPEGLRAIDHYRHLLAVIQHELSNLSVKVDELVLHCDADLYPVLQCNNEFHPNSTLVLKEGTLKVVADLDRKIAKNNIICRAVIKLGDQELLTI